MGSGGDHANSVRIGEVDQTIAIAIAIRKPESPEPEAIILGCDQASGQ